jgi:uncharacterized protein (DUF305 family)
VAFLRQMIPHHRQAVMMALLAERRDAGPQVRDLAARIEDAQRREIAQMADRLQSWDEGYAHGGMGGKGAMGGAYDDDPGDDPGDDDSMMGDGDGMMGHGMLDGAQMHDLVASRGAAFDRLFLSLMIEHHEGALEMTGEEQAEGENEDVVALAEEMEKVQTAEIAEMRRLLTG